MSLSAEAEGRVARALSSYIRDKPLRELPGELKRFRSLRPHAVAARAPEVVQSLEDEGFRGRVVEWLDDKPPLSKKEAEVLRLASARPDGWEQRLEDLTPKAPARGPSSREVDALRERVARERAKAGEARDEARKVKEEARLVLERERRKATELQRDLAAARRELEDAQASMRVIEARAVKDDEARARELRRERRDADRARRERDDLKDRLRAVRKETSELRREIRDLERRLSAARRTPAKKPDRSAKAPRTPKKRRALRPPPGLFEDAPEALVGWLETPGIHVLIDGYNVTKADEGFGDLHLPAQRERLIEEVSRLGVKYDVVPTIVFDGSDVAPGTRRRKRSRVKVEYSSPDEIADDHLVARLADLPPEPVIVVTNDRELQDRARAEGATIATSDQLLALVR